MKTTLTFILLFVALSLRGYGQDTIPPPQDSLDYSVENLQTILSGTVLYVSNIETDKEDYLIVIDESNQVYKIIKDTNADLTIVPLGDFTNYSKRQP